MFFVEKKYKIYQKQDGSENWKSHTQFWRDELCVHHCGLKAKLWWVGAL